MVGVTGFEPAASTSQTQKHRFFTSFYVLFRAFSSENRVFSCHKVHNSHVVQTCKWSRLWSGQIPSPYLCSRIHSSRSSYFISPAATARPTLATSSTEGWILILLIAILGHRIVFGTFFLSCVIIFNPLQRFPRSAYLSFHQSARASYFAV